MDIPSYLDRSCLNFFYLSNICDLTFFKEFFMLHSKISRTTKMYFSFLRIRKYVVALKVIKSPFGLDKCHLQHPAAIDKGQLISE